MKHFITILICLVAISSLQAQNSTPSNPGEKIIKTYFDGWVKKDWNQVTAQLADGFTFTSPAPDDHITTAKFKEKCWPQAVHIKKFDFIQIMETQNQAMAIVHVITKENKVIRNLEYFNFSNGKIKSIEVFFGGNGQGFPTNKKE